MKKILRLGAAVLLAASGLVVAAGTSSAQQAGDIDCDDPPVSNPGVTVPTEVPVLGGTQIVGDEDPCVERVRTLVFVGTAEIDNGVNFAGTGGETPETHGNWPFSADSNDPNFKEKRAGGTFLYTGQCVMVNWENLAQSSAPVGLDVTDCSFGTTDGVYHDPTQPNPIIHPIGQGLEGGTDPTYTGLDWAPADQASCFNSSGSGTSGFESKEPVQALGAGSEVWTAEYSWTNSLTNFVGTVSGSRGANDLGSYTFDAKIQTQADPTAGEPLERTAVGCIEKTLAALQAQSTDQPDDPNIGLNGVLVVGTATWTLVAPSVL